MKAPDQARRLESLSKRLRLEFLRGAEDQSARSEGRFLSLAELNRVLRRYPGDWLDEPTA